MCEVCDCKPPCDCTGCSDYYDLKGCTYCGHSFNPFSGAWRRRALMGMAGI